MEIDKMGEMLLEISAKLNNLTEEFRRVSNGTGFPRCVERVERIRRLEQDVIDLKKLVEDYKEIKQSVASNKELADEIKNKKDTFDTWLTRATWAIIIAGVVKVAFFG